MDDEVHVGKVKLNDGVDILSKFQFLIKIVPAQSQTVIFVCLMPIIPPACLAKMLETKPLLIIDREVIMVGLWN